MKSWGSGVSQLRDKQVFGGDDQRATDGEKTRTHANVRTPTPRFPKLHRFATEWAAAG